ncbi:MAG: hypothetical protein ACO37H_03920, partial [Burkholderiaceae bacterium]
PAWLGPMLRQVTDSPVSGAAPRARGPGWAARGARMGAAQDTTTAAAREAAKLICKARYEQFGCAGQASKIKAVSMVDMAARYKAGQLAQIVQ